jgi:hypothetical protein
LFLKGVMDVGTNNRIVWKNVLSTIDIKGGKTISISVNDAQTNLHFARQLVHGVVTSFTRCSDVPLSNNEVLPPRMSIPAQSAATTFCPSTTATNTGTNPSSPSGNTTTSIPNTTKSPGKSP